MQPASNHLFQPDSEELLAPARDAYLKSTLALPEAAAVEAVLERNSVERGVALARFHELQAERQRQRLQPLVPPHWVQQQLRRQPSVSAWGPLRRPSLQLALGSVLLLSAFSAVRWVNNQPLVPTPVVATFRRTVNAAAQTLGRPVVYTPAEMENLAAPARNSESSLAPAPPALVARPARRPQAAGGVETLAPRVADSVRLARAVPAELDSLLRVGAKGPQPAALANHVVRGRIVNHLGQPLAGATVLVKGTSRAAVTNADGAYELRAPSGATLLIGYAGYQDEETRASEATVDVTLEPERQVRGGRRRERQ